MHVEPVAGRRGCCHRHDLALGAAACPSAGAFICVACYATNGPTGSGRRQAHRRCAYAVPQLGDPMVEGEVEGEVAAAVGMSGKYLYMCA